MPSCLLWTSSRAFSTDTSGPRDSLTPWQARKAVREGSARHSLAPSWSWAAIAGSIRYPRSPVQDPSRKTLAKILSIQSEHRYSQVFGHALSGAIQLSGRLAPIFKPTGANGGRTSLEPGKSTDPRYAMLWAGQPTREVAIETRQAPIVLLWDVYDAADEILCKLGLLRGTYGLPIFYNAETRSLCGLFLLATNRRGEYRRLGVFREWPDDPDIGLFYDGEDECESREWLHEFYEDGPLGGEIRSENLHLYTDDRSLVIV